MEPVKDDMLTQYLRSQAQGEEQAPRRPSMLLGSDPPSLHNVSRPEHFGSHRGESENSHLSYDLNQQSLAPLISGFNYAVPHPLFPFASPFPMRFPPSFVPPSPAPASIPAVSNAEEEDDEDENEKDKKKKQKRQLRGQGPGKEIKDKKKRRLEQNRVSARESRKKKKAYIEMLEAELKQVKHELCQCRAKLNDGGNPSKIQSIFYQDTLAYIKSEIQQRIDKIIFAYSREDYVATDSAVQSLLISYGVQSEERRRTIESLAKGVIECIIPTPYVYLLWSAKHDSGVFNPERLPSGEGTKKDCKESNDDILDYLKLTDVEHLMIYKTKGPLKESLGKVTMKLKRFVEAKKELIGEMNKLDDYVNDQILSKVKTNTVGGFVQWLQKSRNRPEFTELKLFELTKEDFGGFDFGIETDTKEDQLEVYGQGTMESGRPSKRPKIFEQNGLNPS